MTQHPNPSNKPSPKDPQREQTNVPDPRDIERDPAGTMEFPGANPDEPAKKLSDNTPFLQHDDETPEANTDTELGGDPDQPMIQSSRPNRRP